MIAGTAGPDGKSYQEWKQDPVGQLAQRLSEGGGVGDWDSGSKENHKGNTHSVR